MGSNTGPKGERSRNTSTKEGAAWLPWVVLPFTSPLLCGAAFLPLSLGWCCFLPVGCCCRWLPPPLGYGGAAPPLCLVRSAVFPFSFWVMHYPLLPFGFWVVLGTDHFGRSRTSGSPNLASLGFLFLLLLVSCVQLIVSLDMGVVIVFDIYDVASFWVMLLFPGSFGREKDFSTKLYEKKQQNKFLARTPKFEFKK